MNREDIELTLLKDALRLRYGYDLGGYAEASLARRCEHVRRTWRLESISQVQDRVLRDESQAHAFLDALTVTTTELFRDPGSFVRMRTDVVPYLATFPSFNVWVAGCSTGEEAYSVSIILEEAGLLDRARIYATDLNTTALRTAREGVYDAGLAKPWPKAYVKAGGEGSLHDHMVSAAGTVRFNARLRERIVFEQHNLVTDGVFAECHLVLCRNVLIYFTKPLQERCVELFARAARTGAFFAIGDKESLHFLDPKRNFVPLFEEQKIYRRTANPMEGA